MKCNFYLEMRLKMLSVRLSVLKKCLNGQSFIRQVSSGSPIQKKKYSYSFTPGDQKLTYLTLGNVLNEAADLAGDHVAIVSSEQNIKRTFVELKCDADKLASGFISLGLSPGDRLALCTPNIYEFPVTLFAAAKAGLILVNINPAYRENELEYALNKVGCKALVTSETFKTQNYYEMLCNIIPELSNYKGTSISENKKIPSLKNIILLSNKKKNGTILYDDVLSSGDSESRKRLSQVEESVQFDHPAIIQFTSGTTGNPKGAVLSHHNVVNNAHIGNHRTSMVLDQKPVVCCPIPLYHAFGCISGLIGSVVYKNTIVFPSAGFDVAAVFKAVESEKCTRLLGAPTMFVEIIKRYKANSLSLSSLKRATMGGAATPEQLYKDIRYKLDIPALREGFGTTETSPGIALSECTDENFSDILSGYLKPLDFVEVKIVDKDRKLVPIGEDGEICVRGHNVFMGYWNDKAKTDEVLTATRWYHTGDLGRMNDAGLVKLVGRIKDLIIRGGENIYPVEVENFLHKHPSILEVYVCGVPDPKMGEELCAWVMLKEGHEVTADDIKLFCKNKISHFKVPRYILFVDNFPKTTTGKVQKFKMKEISIKQLGL